MLSCDEPASASSESAPDAKRRAVRLGLRMVKGLAEGDARRLVTARSGRPFGSVLELARRAAISTAALTRLATADAFRGLGLGRREAAWAIKALRDDTLPLFAVADRQQARIAPEIAEPAVTLPAMTDGREVVADYRSQGLSLRAHPLAFLRRTLAARGIRPCAVLGTARDHSRTTVAGLVLMRQRPGSAKGVLFVTLEDETGIANLIVWPALLEKRRRIVLGSSLMACRGRVQHGTGVVHLIAEDLADHSALLQQVGGQDDGFGVPTGRGDEARHPVSLDARAATPLRQARDTLLHDLRREDGITVKARDFR